MYIHQKTIQHIMLSLVLVANFDIWLSLERLVFTVFKIFIDFSNENSKIFRFASADLSGILLHTVCNKRLDWNKWTSSETAVKYSQPQGFHLCNVCIPTGNECGHLILGDLCRRPRADSSEIIRIVLPNVRNPNAIYRHFIDFSQFQSMINQFSVFFPVGWIMWCTQMWPFSHCSSYFCHSACIQIERLVFQVYLLSIWHTSFGFISLNTSRADGFIPFW